MFSNLNWDISGRSRKFFLLYFVGTFVNLRESGRDYSTDKDALGDAVSLSYLHLLQVLSDSETVRWLNYAVEKMWTVCMEEIVSQKILLPIVPWFLQKYKPWTVVRV